uniref:Uncharacterized protein n=1 Tax=Arundo donax TaxID=35708 RepID=A0A0A9D051_ARUDO
MSSSLYRASCCIRVERWRVKSSTSSPGLKARFSHSLRNFCSVALRAQSLPMCAEAMAPQASLAVSLSARVGANSSGTAARRASSARRSSENQRRRTAPRPTCATPAASPSLPWTTRCSWSW